MTVRELADILGQIGNDDVTLDAVIDDAGECHFCNLHDISGVAYHNGHWFLTVDAERKNHF